MQFAHLGFKEHDLRPAGNSSSSAHGAIRLSGLSNSSGDGTYSVQKSSSSFSGSSGSAHQLGQLRDIQAAVADYKRPEAAAGLTVSLPNPKLSFTGASGAHVSHLNPAAAAISAAPASPSSSSIVAAGIGPMSPTRSSLSRTSAAGSPLKAGLGLGLKVTLPPETDFELCGSSDSFCFSPNTPGPKPGIKERMKFYFQRQAGAAGGL
jgi:hypothetical protein